MGRHGHVEPLWRSVALEKRVEDGGRVTDLQQTARGSGQPDTQPDRLDALPAIWYAGDYGTSGARTTAAWPTP
jgi:hypothetical protein